MSEIQRKIGILGGSFDPVHLGHIALAKAAMAAYDLDEVRFMPCACQALKNHQPASGKDRCAMLRLALVDTPGLTIDTRELYRTKAIYTYDTIQELRREEPNVQWYFIMGMDSASQFKRWYKWEALLTACQFILFERPGCTPPDDPEIAPLFKHLLRGPHMNIASSEIRNCVAKNAPIRYSIGHQVERYLTDHNLYLPL